MATCLAVLTLLSLVSGGMCAFTAEARQAIDDMAKGLLACKNVPGYQIAVVSSQEVLFLEAYGKSDLENNVPMTVHSPTSIQSTGKSMGAILAAIILDKFPEYSMDTPIRDILGSDFDIEEGRNGATFRDFFLQITGCEFPDAAIEDLGAVSIQDYMRNLKNYAKDGFCFFPLREEFVYQTSGLVVPGLALAEIMGKDIELDPLEAYREILTDEMFKPLGMLNSSLTDTASKRSDFVRSYRYGPDNTVVAIPREVPAQSARSFSGAGYASTASDMAKYMQFILRNGQNENGEQILSPEALAEPFTQGIDFALPLLWHYFIQKPTFPETYTDITHAMHFVSGFSKGYRHYRHPGSYFWYDSWIAFYPDLDLAIFTTANGLEFDEEEHVHNLLNYFILDIVTGDDPTITSVDQACNWVSDSMGEIVHYNREAVPENIPSAIPLENYEGTFGAAGWGCMKLEVLPTNNGLSMEIGNRGTFSLFPSDEGPGSFWLRGTGPAQSWRWSKYLYTYPLYPDKQMVYFSFDGDEAVAVSWFYATFVKVDSPAAVSITADCQCFKTGRCGPKNERAYNKPAKGKRARGSLGRRQRF